MAMKNSSDTIGNGTCDLPACTSASRNCITASTTRFWVGLQKIKLKHWKILKPETLYWDSGETVDSGH